MALVLGTHRSHICDNLVDGYTTIPTSTTPVVMTNNNNKILNFSGTLSQNLQLPVSASLINGIKFEVENNSTGVVTPYAADSISGLTTAAYTFPLTTITVNNIFGTFPGGGGTFSILTTSGLQTITYTSFSAGVFTFASAGSGTAALGSVVSTTINALVEIPPGLLVTFTCVDTTAGVNSWFAPLVNPVLDNTAIPNYPTAPQTQGVWYGSNTKANCSSTSVSVGNGASAPLSYGTAVGQGASVTGVEACAYGYASAAGQYATSLGRNNASGGLGSVCIGNTNNANLSSGGVAIGTLNVVNGSGNSIAIGLQCSTSGASDGSSAIGYQCTATGLGATAIGRSVSATAAGFMSVCIGGTSGAGDSAICIAQNSSAGARSVAIGTTVNSTGAFGGGATATDSVSIGQSILSGGIRSVLIGSGVSSTVADAVAIGTGSNSNSIAGSLLLNASGTALSPISASNALALGLNSLSVAPGRFGLTVNNSGFQLPLYTTLYNSTVSSATPLTLSSTSSKDQYITGTSGQSVMLPRVNNPTLENGFNMTISNKSTVASTVYAAGPINGLTAAAYTFPLTTITVNNIVGTFPAGGGTFLILTTSGLQSIVYTSFLSGVFTFASAGSGTAALRSVVSTVISTVLTLAPSTEYYVTCNDNTAGNTNGNVNGWYVSPLVSGLVMDNLATSIKYPTAPQTEGIWYGSGTKSFTGSSAVNIGQSSRSIGINSIAIGTNANSNNGASGGSHIAIGFGATCTNGNWFSEAAISIGVDASCLMNNTTNQGPIAIGRRAICNYGDVAIGQDAQATAGIAIGASAQCLTGSSIALGGSSYAFGPFGGQFGLTALGYSARAVGSQQTSVGYNARVLDGGACVAIGANSLVSTNVNVAASNQTAVGASATCVSVTGGISIGVNAVVNSTIVNTIGSISIGYNSNVINSARAIALGSSASVTSAGGIAIGASANSGSGISLGEGATATVGIAIGASAISNAASAVSIGPSSVSSATSAIAIGASASSSGASAVAIGASSTATGASTLAILGNTGTSAAIRCLSILGGGNTFKTGTDNLLIGPNVGSVLSTGQINILMGNNTGRYISTGSSNIAIGSNVLQNAGLNSNSTAIGHLALSRMSETSYATGTASQSTLAVTGTSTAWNNAMTAGSWIQYSSGAASMPVRITSTNSPTSITAEAAVTISATSYRITYGTTYAVNAASQSGTTVSGTSTTFTSDMVGGTLTFFGQTYSSGSVSQTGTTITGAGFTASMAPGYIAYFSSFTINPMDFASQTGNVITATGPSFSPGSVGTYVIFTGGNEVAYITQYVNSTTVIVATSRSIASTNFIMTGPQISASLITGFVNTTTLTSAAVSSQTIPAFTPFILFYNNGSPTRITRFNSATSLTVETSQTIASSNYMIQYSPFNNIVNTVYGYAAGENIRDGTNNTLVGASVGADIYNGINNVIVGTANTNPLIDTGNITFGTGNTNAGGVALGRSNTVASATNIAVGVSSQANSTNTIAIGNGAIASAASSVVIGNNITNSASGSVLLGTNGVKLARFDVLGTVTQLTSLTTGVTVNSAQGKITLFSALPATTKTRFTVTNDRVQTTSVINVTSEAEGSTGGFPSVVGIMAITAGTFDLIVYNSDAGATTAAPVIHFTILYPAV